MRPRLDPQLKKAFKQIGVPSQRPFQPDPFQLEALERIRLQDVLVSAPTGAGKTWIASEAIRERRAEGRRVWYASPLKALSNAIYQQFRKEFGRKECGILTGDRKENADAPILVGTTEILRNQLYDAMHTGTSIGAHLVILDEAHYLSDPDRGVVWEEVLIYLPARVRLLLLSATIPNAEEVAAWLERNRSVTAGVVRVEERPVPLETLFLLPDGLMVPLGGARGLSGRVKKYMAAKTNERSSGRRRGDVPAFGEVLRCLRALDLLPAIFFLKSRADCDRALRACPRTGPPPERKERIRAEATAFLHDHPHLKASRQLKPLFESLVGAHHAGQLPAWKLFIEEMMEKGLLEAIFSTSTVAAGVNFPARTVVLVQSDRFDGREFRDLSARDFHQMVGRAGRRGKDRIGFAVVLPGPHQDPPLLHALESAPPEPLQSRIHINFSMTLNLLLSHEPDEVHTLLGRSFAAFQRGEQDSRIRATWDRLVDAMQGELTGGNCDTQDPFEVLEYIEGRAALRKRLREQERAQKGRAARQTLEAYLEPGRLFLHKKGGVHLVFRVYMENDDLVCDALNLEKPLRSRKNRVQLRKVRSRRIKLLFDRRLELPDPPSPRAVQRMLERVSLEELHVLHPEETRGSEAGAPAVQQELTALPCETCDHFKDCHTPKNRTLQRILREIRTLAPHLEGMDEGLWLSFKRHLRFLKETGFVDEHDRLNADGIWASRLRLDHPLLIAHAIRQGAFEGITPEILAGCIAPFVWDRPLDVAVRLADPERLRIMERAVLRVLEAIEGIRMRKTARGFDNPPILFWPSAALFLWAQGVPWEELLDGIQVDEGDMASLVMRTADHLRQVAGVKDTHPQLASCAQEAIHAILREPVFPYENEEPSEPPLEEPSYDSEA